MPDKIGMFGGSFDPVHTAHLIIASVLSQEFRFSKLYFIPNFVSPFKEHITVADITHRLKMIELSIEGNPNFELCTFEADMNRSVYTYETVDYFRNLFPGKELNLILGLDSYLNIKKWKNYEHILGNVKIIIAERPGAIFSPENKTSSFSVSKSCPKIDMSSTMIRDMVAKKIDIKYLVNERVRHYIEDSRLYQVTMK